MITKYYRVGAFHKGEKGKQVIIQAYDMEEAKSWVPRVKEMLYPDEDTAKHHVHIFEFELQINMNNLKHYRITVNRPTKEDFKSLEEEMDYNSSLAFDALIEAKDAEEAKAKFFKDWFDGYSMGKTPEEYDVYIDEVPLDELIEKEQRMLRQRLVTKYISENFGDMSVREFNQMMRRSDWTEQNQMFYKSLVDHLKRLRLSEYLEQRLDSEKLTHAEFCKIRDELCLAKEGGEFEKINLQATKKYGKKE